MPQIHNYPHMCSPFDKKKKNIKNSLGKVTDDKKLAELLTRCSGLLKKEHR